MPLTNEFQLFYPAAGQEHYEAQFAETFQKIDRLLKRLVSDGEVLSPVPAPGVLFMTVNGRGLVTAARAATLGDLHPDVQGPSVRRVTRAGAVEVDEYGHVVSIEEGTAGVSVEAFNRLVERVAALEAGGGGGGGGGVVNDDSITLAFSSSWQAAAPLTLNVYSSANDANGSIVAYETAFGDGSTASGANVSHTYGSVGYKDITVMARSSDGGSKSAVLRHLVPPQVRATNVPLPAVAAINVTQPPAEEEGASPPPATVTVNPVVFHAAVPGGFAPTGARVILRGSATIAGAYGTRGYLYRAPGPSYQDSELTLIKEWSMNTYNYGFDGDFVIDEAVEFTGDAWFVVKAGNGNASYDSGHEVSLTMYAVECVAQYAPVPANTTATTQTLGFRTNPPHRTVQVDGNPYAVPDEGTSGAMPDIWYDGNRTGRLATVEASAGAVRYYNSSGYRFVNNTTDYHRVSLLDSARIKALLPANAAVASARVTADVSVERVTDPNSGGGASIPGKVTAADSYLVVRRVNGTEIGRAKLPGIGGGQQIMAPTAPTQVTVPLSSIGPNEVVIVTMEANVDVTMGSVVTTEVVLLANNVTLWADFTTQP